MRCVCCNSLLSDFEATRRCASTGDFLDMCNDCYYTVRDDIEVFERYDLRHESDIEMEEDDGE
jgi:hypothetical protein